MSVQHRQLIIIVVDLVEFQQSEVDQGIEDESMATYNQNHELVNLVQCPQCTGCFTLSAFKFMPTNGQGFQPSGTNIESSRS